MMSISTAYNHAKSWGDDKTIARLKSSRSKDVMIAEAEEILKNMALRFERSPNANTTKLWASDIINAGFTDEQLKQICISIPFKMEKHPTLSDLMAFLRPLGAVIEDFPIDELTDLSKRCYPHLKAKFLTLANQETLDKMTAYYKREVLKSNSEFVTTVEQCVLNDWLRSYFATHPEKIIEQGRKSNEAYERNDKDYFIAPLRRYAQEHRL